MSLLDEINRRLHGEISSVEAEAKTLSTRVPREMFDKVDYVCSFLQMSKSEFLKMVIEHALNDIIKEYELSWTSSGPTPSELDDFNKMSDEEKKAIIDKWQQEAKSRKKEVSK